MERILLSPLPVTLDREKLMEEQDLHLLVIECDYIRLVYSNGEIAWNCPFVFRVDAFTFSSYESSSGFLLLVRGEIEDGSFALSDIFKKRLSVDEPLRYFRILFVKLSVFFHRANPPLW